MMARVTARVTARDLGWFGGYVRVETRIMMMDQFPGVVRPPERGWFGGYVHVETRIMMMDLCDRQYEQMARYLR